MDHNVTENAARDIKQDHLVALLLTGMSITDAAKLIGISRMTASRWMKLQEVKSALAGGKAEIEKSAHDIIIERYKEALEDSCQVVVDIMNEQNYLVATAAARLKAVQMIHDRLAPMQAKGSDQPLQGSQEGMGVLVPHELISYLAPEEMAQIENFIGLAEQRKVQAEKDVETLERKRG